jgi:hypothetical protein
MTCVSGYPEEMNMSLLHGCNNSPDGVSVSSNCCGAKIACIFRLEPLLCHANVMILCGLQASRMLGVADAEAAGLPQRTSQFQGVGFVGVIAAGAGKRAAADDQPGRLGAAVVSAQVEAPPGSR